MDDVLVNIEGKVANKESVALGADGITVTLGTVGSAGSGVGIGGASVGIVEVDITALDVLALHGLVGLGGVLGGIEVDVTEATAATAHLVSNDAGTDETTEGLESLVEDVIIDGPAQVTSEESGGSVGLGLLGLGLGLILILSLALLRGGLLSLGLRLIRLLLRVGVGVIRITIGVGSL